MSWQKPLLNRWLAFAEKPFLARVEDPPRIRRRFERTARLMFHPPRGTAIERIQLGDLEALRVRPPGPVHRTLLYFHGGAYIFGSPETHSALLAHIARAAQAEAILPRYPLAPEHQFPAAPDAALRAWDALETAHPVILGGDSAGGGLALSLLGMLCARGGARPAGLFALSALTDMTYSGASISVNAEREVLLPAGRARDMTAFYLPPGVDPADPRASPLFAEFQGAPPVWLGVGDTEILLDDTRRMVACLRAQGTDVTLQIAQDLPHVWPIFHNTLPEARATIAQVGAWIRRVAPES
ncbi:MAG: alpha/beta hydrolase fold domain-containing protein [Pseudomonadota bacterium]